MPTKLKKFKLKDFLYRVRELKLIADVFINGEEFKNYPVGSVKLRGVEDPQYAKRSLALLEEYQDTLSNGSDAKQIRAAAEALQLKSVIISIEDWDVDLFDMPFTPENAWEVFSDPNHNMFFNQIAQYIKERDHFLPPASAPHGIG